MNYLLMFLIITALILTSPTLAQSEEFQLLYPADSIVDRMPPSVPPSSPLDTWYKLIHTDGFPEYFLSNGAEDDTFFVVFEAPAPCSVHQVDFQWYSQGEVEFFAACYSEEAAELYPQGIPPNRGESPVSPIGELLSGFTMGSVEGTLYWEQAVINPSAFQVGDNADLEPVSFGVGFIKQDQNPCPLADRMQDNAFPYTCTWFGGPWTATYDNTWGAYNSSYG